MRRFWSIRYPKCLFFENVELVSVLKKFGESDFSVEVIPLIEFGDDIGIDGDLGNDELRAAVFRCRVKKSVKL